MENKLKQNNIGSDETGVGDYLTPLVAAAVFVPYQNINKLKLLGVKDSKKISNKKIKIIAKKIKPYIRWRVEHLTQKGYNKLNRSFNANELKMFLHIKAINNLEFQIKNISQIIIDQFSTEKSIKKYYNKLLNKSFNFKPFKAKLLLVEKAETKHIEVACASIIAREALLNMMEIQNKKWNTIFPLGTNKIVKEFVSQFISKHGQKSLQEVAKIKFNI